MRSIGKRNIKKLHQIVDEEMKGGSQPVFSFHAPVHNAPLAIRERIINRIPVEWYEIWESAWNEIERLVDDRMSQIRYGKVSV